jgi:hypothetical protein
VTYRWYNTGPFQFLKSIVNDKKFPNDKRMLPDEWAVYDKSILVDKNHSTARGKTYSPIFGATMTGAGCGGHRMSLAIRSGGHQCSRNVTSPHTGQVALTAVRIIGAMAQPSRILT